MAINVPSAAANAFSGPARSDAVLKRTLDLSSCFGDQEATSEQIKQGKIDALAYAHRMAVQEKRFKFLNESADKLFETMVNLSFELLDVASLKELLYQYRSMSTNS
ncbi:MAG: hypothetical protein MHPSP_000520, partial [Paramarteilia canceri]